MKIHCNKDELVDGVQTVQSGLSSRTTLPILLNFLIETEKSRLKVVSTDLEMGVRHYLPAEIVNEGSITIPAKKFVDILHSLPEGQEIRISVDAGGRLQLQCGKSVFGIMGAPKSEYPLLPEFNQQAAFEVPAAQLGEMISRTIFAAATDEIKHALNGVYWTAKGGTLEMAATDGRRLAVEKRDILDKGKNFHIIVPKKILGEFLRLLSSWGIKEGGEGEKENASISVSENQISIRVKDTTLLSRLISGQYPKYDQLIPSKKDGNSGMAVIKTENFLAVTRRAALCATERGGSVKYTLSRGTLKVNAASPYLNFDDEIPASYDGQEISVAFNPQFVVEALKHTESEETGLTVSSSFNPALLEPAGKGKGGYFFIVMPMRVS